MKSLIPLIFLSVFILTAPCVSAAPDTVMVVFNGNTEVNRHVYKYIGQVLQSSGGGSFRVVATLDPSTVKAGVYKAVIVVSTKTSTGVDPALAAFMKSYSSPKELYLISLLARTGSLSVTPILAASSPQGVDGVTAATTWSMGSQAMHTQWMQDLVTYLASK